MKWLKLHNEARTDKKLAILTLAERGIWVNLLCYANEQEERGTFDASDRYVLALECAEGDEETLNSLLDKLLRVRHLVEQDDGRMVFRTFAKRQYEKPSDEPVRVGERVRKYREKHKEAEPEGVTKEVKRDVTRSNALDTDTDTELDTERDTAKGERVLNKSKRIRPPLAASADASPQPRPLNPLWDELVAQFHQPQGDVERNKFGKAVNELKKLKATVEDIRLRVEHHRTGGYHWDLTPHALISHWGELAEERAHAATNNGTGTAYANGAGSRRGAVSSSAPAQPDAHNHGPYAHLFDHK